MPSDRFASALAAALTLRELHPAAGAALAAGVAALERPLTPLARRIDAASRRLEPA